jgi:hypothetical protein
MAGIPKSRHLLDNMLEFTKPRVALLSSGGIENPLTIVPNELTEAGRVAVNLTECVALFVFALEVPDIDRKTDKIKVMIT